MRAMLVRDLASYAFDCERRARRQRVWARVRVAATWWSTGFVVGWFLHSL